VSQTLPQKKGLVFTPELAVDSDQENEAEDDEDHEHDHGRNMLRRGNVTEIDPVDGSTVVYDKETGLVKSDEPVPTLADPEPPVKRQTFLFSATLLHAPKIRHDEHTKVGRGKREARRLTVGSVVCPALVLHCARELMTVSISG
jgi:hypothetical protein